VVPRLGAWLAITHPHIRFFGNVGSLRHGWLSSVSSPVRVKGFLPVGAVPFRERTAPNVIVEPMIRLADRVPLIPRTNDGLGDFELEHIP